MISSLKALPCFRERMKIEETNTTIFQSVLQTRLHQFRNYQRLAMREPATYDLALDQVTRTNSTYKVFHRQMQGSNGLPLTLIIIKEKSDYKYGGSLFHIRASGSHFVAECPYRDYFNGTYVSHCVFIENCVTVTIELAFIKYSAFWQFVPKIQPKGIFKFKTCAQDQQNISNSTNEQNISQTNIQKPYLKGKTCDNLFFKKSGLSTFYQIGVEHFQSDNTTYSLKHNNCIIHENSKILKKCGWKLNQFYFLGKY